MRFTSCRMLATSGRRVAASRRGTIMSCRKQGRTTDEKNMSEKDFYWIGSRGHLISSKIF
jgi:hypothetical protein